MPDEASGMTERQKAWMASIREGMLKETGRSLEAWALIARTCPETKHRARLAWFKTVHGLGQNRASVIMHEAFKGDVDDRSSRDAGAMSAGLWALPAQAAVFDSVKAAVGGLPEVVTGQRKSFTSFSRAFQFAAARPVKAGGVRLGLAVSLHADPRLQPRGNESWSERLLAKLDLASEEDVDERVKAMLRAAWEKAG